VVLAANNLAASFKNASLLSSLSTLYLTVFVGVGRLEIVRRVVYALLEFPSLSL